MFRIEASIYQDTIQWHTSCFPILSNLSRLQRGIKAAQANSSTVCTQHYTQVHRGRRIFLYIKQCAPHCGRRSAGIKRRNGFRERSNLANSRTHRDTMHVYRPASTVSFVATSFNPQHRLSQSHRHTHSIENETSTKDSTTFRRTDVPEDSCRGGEAATT